MFWGSHSLDKSGIVFQSMWASDYKNRRRFDSRKGILVTQRLCIIASNWHITVAVLKFPGYCIFRNRFTDSYAQDLQESTNFFCNPTHLEFLRLLFQIGVFRTQIKGQNINKACRKSVYRHIPCALSITTRLCYMGVM